MAGFIQTVEYYQRMRGRIVGTTDFWRGAKYQSVKLICCFDGSSGDVSDGVGCNGLCGAWEMARFIQMVEYICTGAEQRAKYQSVKLICCFDGSSGVASDGVGCDGSCGAWEVAGCGQMVEYYSTMAEGNITALELQGKVQWLLLWSGLYYGLITLTCAMVGSGGFLPFGDARFQVEPRVLRDKIATAAP